MTSPPTPRRWQITSGAESGSPLRGFVSEATRRGAFAFSPDDLAQREEALGREIVEIRLPSHCVGALEPTSEAGAAARLDARQPGTCRDVARPAGSTMEDVHLDAPSS
jgi:hypothetical protein